MKTKSGNIEHGALNLGLQPLGSDALLSEPLRHVLLGIPYIVFGACTTLILDLYHLVRANRSYADLPSNTCLNGSGSRASDPSGWGPWFNTHWGTFYCWIFCFHVVRPVMPILPISPNLWKTQFENKKVLLCERKRHTTCHVASTCYAVPVGGTSLPLVRSPGGMGTPTPWPLPPTSPWASQISWGGTPCPLCPSPQPGQIQDRGVPPWPGQILGWRGTSPPSTDVDRQTPVKTVRSLFLRTRAVITLL